MAEGPPLSVSTKARRRASTAAARAQARDTARPLRRAQAAVAAAEESGAAAGAALPPVFRLAQTRFRLETVATPPGSDAPPARVWRFEAQTPVQRLARAGVLSPAQVGAAGTLAFLHASAVKPARVTSSYDGVGGGSAAPSCWVDVHCDAWARLSAGLAALLPVERRVALEVVVHETPVHALRACAVVLKPTRADAAVVQTLALALDRLRLAWGLDAGSPQV